MTQDSTSRFAALVRRPEFELVAHLDELALLIAAHAHPNLDIDRQRRRLDDLAAGCATNRLADIAHHLFVEEGFRGNDEDYYDPRNSYLDDVLDRRLGIPITLAVVLIEVARRLGLDLAGVNTPGHFLVRLGGDPPIFVDPFNGGDLVSPAAFAPEYLEPVGPLTIVARM